MADQFSSISTYLLVALFLFAVYWRLRRTFGKQLLRPARLRMRMILFVVIAVLVFPTAWRSPAFAVAAFGGLAVGVSLAVWGASRTGFERDGGRLFYIPHTYTGVAVSLLFLGRVAFRFLQALPAGGVGAPGAGGFKSPPDLTSVSSPLTLGLLYVLVGYYPSYFGLVLRKSRRFPPDEGYRKLNATA